jgi:hypothetical protein
MKKPMLYEMLIRLPRTHRAWLKGYAAERGVSYSLVVRRMIDALMAADSRLKDKS